MKYDFSKKVDELLTTQRRTKKSLYDRLGMTGNGFDAMMKNNTFSAVRLAEIADFFGIQIAELYGESAPQKVNGVEKQGDAYLQEHLATLERNFEKLLEQLLAKDNQIADLQESRRSLQESQRSLQDMLKMVLGKSRSVTFTQLPSEDEAFDQQYDNYVGAAVQRISDMFGVSMQRPVLHT